MSYERSKIVELLDEKNYLGAVIYVKESHLSRADEAIEMGLIINKIIEQLKSSPKSSEEEAFLKAQLSYILRDYPGLSQFYREFSLNQRNSESFLDSVGKAFKKASDIASGKVDVEAEIKENIELNTVLRDAEKNIRSGINQASEFLQGLMGEKPQVKSEPSATDESGQSIKVNIVKDDKDLPPDIDQRN